MKLNKNGPIHLNDVTIKGERKNPFFQEKSNEHNGQDRHRQHATQILWP